MRKFLFEAYRSHKQRVFSLYVTLSIALYFLISHSFSHTLSSTSLCRKFNSMSTSPKSRNTFSLFSNVFFILNSTTLCILHRLLSHSSFSLFPFRLPLPLFFLAFSSFLFAVRSTLIASSQVLGANCENSDA